MSLRKIAGVAGAAFIASLLAAAAAHAATVVASRGPSAAQYPVGKKLEAGTRLALASGDTVTLLDGRGTRVLTGPGTFSAAQTSEATRQSVFTALVRDRTSVRVRTGSVRNGPNGEPPRSPNLWYVDVSRPGRYCLADPANVRLWRPMPGEAAVITVKAGQASQQVSFAREDLVAPWDSVAIPVKSGVSYELLGADGVSMGTASFETLASSGGTMEDLAARLIEKGCTIQLDLLAATVQLPPEE